MCNPSVTSDRERIYLTGFMGAGKTTVGRLLARSLGWEFIDLDEEIVSAAGVSITRIFAEQGEKEFRSLEAAALRAVGSRSRSVISTGGGVVTDPANRRFMHETGLLVNLAITAEEVLQRLSGDRSRPLLSGEDRSAKITTLLAERADGYADADLVIDTTGRSPVELVQGILAWIKQRSQ